jgi:hypothetical protein
LEEGLGREERFQGGFEGSFKTFSEDTLILLRDREDSASKISDDFRNMEQLEAAYKDELRENSQELEDRSKAKTRHLLLQVHR